MIYRVRDMFARPGCDAAIEVYTERGTVKQAWVRAVVHPFYGERLRSALAVLFGKAYAVKWPEPGELEETLTGVEFKRRES